MSTLGRPERIAIVGASAAGVAASRALRAEGFEGVILLFDADPNLPYERPPLSKRVLEDPAATPADFALLTAEDAATLRIDLRLGTRVAALDAERRALRLEGGGEATADAILLATGGVAVRPRLPGGELAGVHVIRHFADAEAFRSDLRAAARIGVVGGGLIGAEAASALARQGRSVVWVDATPAPLAHIFPEAVAHHLVAAHQAGGVALHLGAAVARLLERDGRVGGLELATGEQIEVDAVVFGIGMAPNDQLARAAGLAVGGGVHIGPDYQTSAAGIYAAGDVAAVWDAAAGEHRRHEHWRVAEEQGAAAARAMLGLEVAPLAIPWFWSDQGAHHIEMAGRRTGEGIVRQAPDGPVAFEFDAGRLVGVASVNQPTAVRIGLRLIQSGRPLDHAILANPQADLRHLLKAS